MGAELFGGEPSGTNWPIMAGVPLLLPGTDGYLKSVSDEDVSSNSYLIPVAESKDANGEDEGLWTGLAFINPHTYDQTLKINYLSSTGAVLGSQEFTVRAVSKEAITINDLLKQAGLENIRNNVSMVKIYSLTDNAPVSNNLDVLVYALHGGLKIKDGG